MHLIVIHLVTTVPNTIQRSVKVIKFSKRTGMVYALDFFSSGKYETSVFPAKVTETTEETS
jgi:hypothetical protein